MNKLPHEKRCAVVRALVKGCSIRSTVRMPDVSKNTVTKLLVDLSNACSEYQRKVFRPILQPPFRFASIVAAVAIVVGAYSVWDGGSDANRLFAQVANRFAAVRSLTCRIQFVDDSKVELADGEFGDKLTYLAPSLHQIDRLNGSVEIIDAASKTMMSSTVPDCCFFCVCEPTALAAGLKIAGFCLRTARR